MNWYINIKLASPIGPNTLGLTYLDVGHNFEREAKNYLWFLTIDGDFESKSTFEPRETHAQWDEWRHNNHLGTIVAEGRVECRRGRCVASMVPRYNLLPRIREKTIRVVSKILDQKFNNPRILEME